MKTAYCLPTTAYRDFFHLTNSPLYCKDECDVLVFLCDDVVYFLFTLSTFEMSLLHLPCVNNVSNLQPQNPLKEWVIQLERCLCAILNAAFLDEFSSLSPSSFVWTLLFWFPSLFPFQLSPFHLSVFRSHFLSLCFQSLSFTVILLLVFFMVQSNEN